MRYKSRMLLRALAILASTASWQSPDPATLDEGSYEFRLEGELSGLEVGAARFTADAELDGEEAFVVKLLTPVLEGGVFLAFPGSAPPRPGEYEPVRVATKGMNGYRDVELDPGQVAVFYYEMERQHMVLLGATGRESRLEVTESDGGRVRGGFDVELEGATGNPSAFLRVRPRTGRIVGAFDAVEGDVEFRKP